MLEETVLAIYLICGGGGQQISRETATAVRNYDYTNSVSIDRTVRSGYDDEVAVEIIGTEGRMRVPDALKPKIRSGGENGWWKLKDLRVGPDEIRAKISLNFINQPSVRIDRRTGNISIRGKNGNFSGYCQRYDPENTPRKF